MTNPVMPAIALVAFFVVGASAPVQAQQPSMSFFVTSVGIGKGGDLGGLGGADRHCQSLAQAAGAGNKTWRAYLSTQGSAPVNAKDRIGRGPWFNAKGVQIAASVADLHSDNNKINKETALDEKGMTVKGRGDTPNQHDMLTGTRWILTRSATPSIALLHRQIHRQKAFPFQIPSFHRTLRASSRLGRKEYRAGSMKSGVALRVRIQDTARWHGRTGA